MMKNQTINIRDNGKEASGILLIPSSKKSLGIVIAHGAGGNMNAPFIDFFQHAFAEEGYPCLKFNFFYSEAKRKVPDPQPVLLRCYEKAIEAMSQKRLVIGGKSMGGRMASYIANNSRVAGLLFLGYPLHAPAKQDQLRDQHLYEIRKPMMFVSGTKDPFARIDLLERTISKIGDYATTHLVEGGGHSFEVRGHPAKDVQSEAAQAILKWLQTL